MALKPQLTLRQSQRLALTPVMRNALSVLRMTAQELAEEIEREALRNPFLLREGPPGRTSTDSAPRPDLAAGAASLQVSLAHQLALMDLPGPVEAAALLLVGELREDGVLDVSLQELGAELDLDLTLLQTALAALQRCEPAGVGARDLAECLRLQLIDRGLSPDQADLTMTHIQLFAARDWAAIERTLGLPRAEARRRADMVRTLSPRPVPESAPQANQTVLERADLVVERGGNETLSVRLEPGAMPRVRLDEALVRQAAQGAFAPELLARAQSLVSALDQRGQTLRRIGAWLAENQAAFFCHGPAALKPVTRAEMAAALELHPSTISRAVAGKAIDVDGRLWPLSVFFSGAIRATGGEVSSHRVRRRIAELIAAEPATSPLSDKAVVEQLHTEGVDIARRTVTKYRQGLRIPSSATRRRRALARQNR